METNKNKAVEAISKRVFIGFRIPTLPPLLAMRNRLKHDLPADIFKWTPVENWHITLLFLGQVSSDDLHLYRSLIKRVAAKHKAFISTIAGLGVFPFSKAPRVLYSGLSPAEPFLSIFNSLLQEMAELNLTKPTENYHPHITLARIRHPYKVPDLKAQIKVYEQDLSGEMEIDSLALFESILRPIGAVYEILYEVPFNPISIPGHKRTI